MTGIRPLQCEADAEVVFVMTTSEPHDQLVTCSMPSSAPMVDCFCAMAGYVRG
jgi:hypothetical protein